MIRSLGDFVGGRAGTAKQIALKDWEPLPRVVALRLEKVRPTDHAEIHRRLSEFFEKALCALAQSDELNDWATVHRQHVLEGRTIDEMLALREEQGAPISRRTLQNRLRAAESAIAAWASESDVIPSAVSPSRLRRRRTVATISAWIVIAAVATGYFRIRPAEVAGVTPGECPSGIHFPSSVYGRQLEGHKLSADDPLDWLGTFISPEQLPDFGAKVMCAMALKGVGGCPRVVFGTGRGGDLGSSVVMWDPATQSINWAYTFDPPPDELRMEVPPEPASLTQRYFVRSLAYVRPENDRPGVIVAVCWQVWSQNFVLLIDERDGHLLGRYAHDGALFPPAIMDVDMDGRLEIVMGGCDNVLDQPVLVALDPTMKFGGASSVAWSAGEAAKFRVIFPTLSRFQLEAGTPKKDWYPANNEILRVYELTTDRFDPQTEILTAVVGMNRRHAYYAYLKRGHIVMPGSTVALGTADEGLWESLGIPLKRARELEAEIRVVKRGQKDETQGL